MKVGSNPATTDLRREGRPPGGEEAETGPVHDQPRDATEGQQPPETKKDVRSTEGANPANTWMPDFWPPELRKTQVLCFKPPQQMNSVGLF